MSIHRKPFTLVELLVVIAIIAILAGMLLPALAGAKEHARRTRARTEMKALQTAITMYESDYGYLPMGGAERVLSAAEYTGLVGTLQNVVPYGNARGKRYLDVVTEMGPGVFTDPWDRTYKVALDLDYDGEIQLNTTNGPYEKVFSRVAIWSLDRNGVDDLGKKLNSWRQ